MKNIHSSTERREATEVVESENLQKRSEETYSMSEA